VSNETWGKRILRYALIGGGASAMASAVIGVISAYELIEPSDAQTVGITPGDFLSFYALMLLGGAAMIFVGLRLRKIK
jgi:putative flippase GtrA